MIPACLRQRELELAEVVFFFRKERGTLIPARLRQGELELADGGFLLQDG